MARLRNTTIALAGLLALVLLATNSCVYIETGDGTSWHFGGNTVKHEREVPLTAPLKAGSSFAAETRDGSITVRGVETDECKVVAKIAAHARTRERAQELAEQIEVRLEPAGNGLKAVIEGPHSLMNASYSVSLEVQVPVQTSLTLSTADGSVHLTGITGAIDVRTSDGSIEAETVQGNVKLQTSDGGITLTNVRGDSLNARTGDGNIEGRGLAVERADYQTSDGSIQIEYAPDGPKAPHVTATTSDGGITFTAPRELSATIDASTGDGSIHIVSLALTLGRSTGKSLTGTVGKGEGKVYLRTNDGSITIR